mgnify:CR=1 FL=1
MFYRLFHVFLSFSYFLYAFKCFYTFFVAKGLADWSPLSTYIAAPCLLVVFIQLFNDESPRWLINKSYIYEANELCKKIARVNGRQVEKSYLSENENLNEEDEVSEESFKLAMQKPRLRKTIFNLCFQVKFLIPFFLEILFFSGSCFPDCTTLLP